MVQVVKLSIYGFVGINSLHSLFSMNFFSLTKSEKSYTLWECKVFPW